MILFKLGNDKYQLFVIVLTLTSATSVVCKNPLNLALPFI